jgi:cytochrome c556
MFYRTMVAGLVLTGLSVAALAHSGATGVVKERMDAMKAMGDAVKQIKPMMSGEAPYDSQTVRDAARVIDSHAGSAMTEKFPEGSTEAPSEALPVIWEEWSRFETLARQLSEAARGLEMAADNGLHGAGQMMGDGSGMMGDTGHMMGDGSGMMGDGSGMMGGGMMSGQSGMMGGDGSGGMMTAEDLGRMPADGVFVMMTQACSACHDRFRKED